MTKISFSKASKKKHLGYALGNLKIASELIQREMDEKDFDYESTVAAVWIAEGDVIDALLDLDQFFKGTGRVTGWNRLKRGTRI